MQSIIKHFQVLLPQQRAHVTGWQPWPKYIIILMWRYICTNQSLVGSEQTVTLFVLIKVCIPIVHCHCTMVGLVVDLIIRKTSSVF